VYTDSKYVSDAINKRWLDSWVRQNWRKKGGDVKNPELWQELLPLLERHEVTFVWVKGHAENEYNNRCDELAVAESRKVCDA
jgi:ribonuclease HI